MNKNKGIALSACALSLVFAAFGCTEKETVVTPSPTADVVKESHTDTTIVHDTTPVPSPVPSTSAAPPSPSTSTSPSTSGG